MNTKDIRRQPQRLVLGVLFSLLAAARLVGQMTDFQVVEAPAHLESGALDNPGEDFLSIDLGSVNVPGAPWIRVHFAAYQFGSGSFLLLTSTADGDFQVFNAQSLADWYDWSGMFNGAEVRLMLQIAPGDTGVFVKVDATRTPAVSKGGEPGPDIRSICGANDDRVASADPRVGRMTNAGCTGWLVSNGAVLSAGHCPVAPGDTIDFNVPASYANGIVRPAALANQYPINVASAVSENSGVGQDWLVFALNPNATTGLRAHVVQGFFRMTKSIPANGTTIRVTGCGLDNAPAGGGSVCVGGTNDGAACTTNANCPPAGTGQCRAAPCCDPDGTGALPCGFNCNTASQTQQTHTGTIVSSNTNLITHSADTMPANSGSPMIWEANGFTIGIHTAGGCTSTGGSNNATRFSRLVLENAIHDFLGGSVVYVDAFNFGVAANGRVFEPLHTVPAAVSLVGSGGTIALVAGSYTRAAGNTFVAGADGKPLTIVAPAGTATIGN